MRLEVEEGKQQVRFYWHRENQAWCRAIDKKRAREEDLELKNQAKFCSPGLTSQQAVKEKPAKGGHTKVL